MAIAARLRRVAGGALRLPWQERLRGVIAAAALARARLALALFPFARAIQDGSVPLGRSRAAHPDQLVASWSRAVRRASYASPWRTVCIHEGLALQRLLRRRGVPAVLCYGSNQLSGELSAHVWVKVGDAIVIGEEEAGNYRQLAVFGAEDGQEAL